MAGRAGAHAERLPEILAFATEAREAFDAIVLLGMGGSSLAPEVLRRATGAERFHVLDTTHPAAVRRLAESLDPERTLFLVSSKSGTTLETRSHLDFFWELTRGRGESFAAITDPGSELEALAGERGFRAVFHGEPTIGGRYSALSPFGVVPAALMGVDVEALLADAVVMAERCRSAASPGVELGLALGAGWRDGRDKIVFANPHGFGLWLEQLLAESTGKEGKGLVPAPENDAGGTRPPGGGGPAGRRPRRRDLPLGGRGRGRRRRARHQPLRPAQRPGGEGRHPGCPFRPRTGPFP